MNEGIEGQAIPPAGVEVLNIDTWIPVCVFVFS